MNLCRQRFRPSPRGRMQSGPPGAAVRHLSGIMAVRTPLYQTCLYQVETFLTHLVLSRLPQKASDRGHTHRRGTVPLAAKPA
jgi:hypothetical protein